MNACLRFVSAAAFRAAVVTPLLLLSLRAAAPVPVLLKDINPAPGNEDSDAHAFHVVGNSLYFEATALTGIFVFKTDGTETGTVRLKRLSIDDDEPEEVLQGGEASGTFFFSVDDAERGRELWKSDGTKAGTSLVKDINPGSSGSDPRYFASVGGTVFFAAGEDDHGIELWKSDGTAAGTVMVKDIHGGAVNSSPEYLTVLGTAVYFSAGDGVNGSELWKSTGTAAGTTLVKDIRPGANGSSISDLFKIGSTIYFRADDGTNGAELWKTDGTAGGTMMVKNINATAGGSSYPAQFVDAGGILYFTADDGVNGRELWKSDGTAAGTTLVKNIKAGSADPSIGDLIYAGSGILYFTADDGVSGRELWKTNGTSAGTVIVKDIVAGSGSSYASGLAKVGTTIFFTANDGTNGYELWKTDGTAAGTVIVKDIRPGASGSSPDNLTSVNGVLLFVADDGVHGEELWRSDGTAGGTTQVADLNKGEDSIVHGFATLNGSIYFSTSDGVNGAELWKSNGTAAGTTMVKDINPGADFSSPRFPVEMNGAIYFQASADGMGHELWKSDGTAGGTTLVKDLVAGYNAESPNVIVNVNGTLYFTHGSDAPASGLWKSDGTTAGTVPVENAGFAQRNLTKAGNALFYSAYAPGGSNREQVWKTDGTPGGTVMLSTQADSPTWLTAVNGVVYFAAYHETLGYELWKSDGTVGGTTVVKDINPGDSAQISSLAEVNGTLYFGADDGTHGLELWKTDGTAAGTVMVKDINPTGYSDPSNMTYVNGTIFFKAYDDTNGYELWKTDGTAAGTSLVKDICSGDGSSSPDRFINVNGTLYFTADDGVHGIELWKSDGTAAGTVMVADLADDAGSSEPEDLYVVGTTLYFTAVQDGVGREIFVLDTVDPTAAPTLISTTPTHNATNVRIDANLTLTFSKTVQAGTGNIILRPATGSDVSISVTDSSQVTFSGTTVTINPTANLAPTMTYNVIIGGGVIKDGNNNSFAGISTGARVFTTAVAPPVINSTLAASGTYGSSFATYTIAGTNSPTSYAASGLPPGLSINTANGQISGTPTSVSGSPFSVAITATNAGGTGSATLVITINKRPLTVAGITASGKTYDGTATAAINTTSTSIDKLSADDVVLNTSAATGSFANKNVGVDKTVTISGLTISGAQSSNYALSSITTTATITAKTLRATGLAATSKIYDGTTTAPLTGSVALLSAEVAGTGDANDNKPYSGDAVSLAGTATGSFANRHAGSSKTVSVSGLSLTGADASNYSFGGIVGALSANITAKALTASGLATSNKVYDATTTIALSGTAALQSSEAAGTGSTGDGKPYTGDAVSLTGTPAGSVADRHVATGKTVTISGLSLTGAEAGNYTLTAFTGFTANITAKPLTTSGLSAANRVYDATTAAPLTGTAALLAAQAPGAGNAADGKPYTGDTITIAGTPTGAFADRHAGSAKPITVSGLSLGGAQGGNYALVAPTGLTANVTAKSLTVSGVTASDKTYDATTVAALGGIAALPSAEAPGAGNTSDGKPYTGDTLGLTGTMSGAFSDRHAGAAKTVTVTGVSLDGAEKNNYAFSTLTATATIAPKALTISGVSATDRVYNATTVAPLAGTPTLATAGAPGSGSTADGAPYLGDTVSIDGSPSGAFDDRHAGLNKAVTVTGLALTGAEKDNYTPTQPAGLTASVMPKPLNIVGLSGVEKVYDGTTGAALAGTPGTQRAQAPGAGSVTDGRPYAGDFFSIAGTAAAAFADKDVGTDKPLTVTGLSFTGADAADYTVTHPTSLTAAITPKTLTSSGLVAVARIYDGTTNVPLSGVVILAADEAPGSGDSGDGRPYTGDAVSIAGLASGAYADRHVGVGKSVTIAGLSLSGAQSGNYALTPPAGVTGVVTTKALAVQGVSGVNKVYDATTTASLGGTAALLAVEPAGTGSTTDGKPYIGDVVSLSGAASVTFANKLVGTDKPITVTGLALSGTDASNYAVTQPSGLVANITAKNLTVGGVTVVTKSFDYGTNADLSFSSSSLVGIAGSDTVTLVTTAATGTYASRDAGSGIAVTVAGLTLGGADAPNYTLTPPSLTGAITKAAVIVQLAGLAQIYNGTPRVVTASSVLSGLLIDITYNGSSTAPTDAGSYSVAAAVNENNFTGVAAGTLLVTKATQTITIGAPSSAITVGTAFTLTATTNSGLPVTFSVVSGPATLSGSSLTLNGAAPVVVRATQAGNMNYESVTAERTFTVSGKQPQTIAFGALANMRTGDAPVTLSATASSGLPVSFTIVSGPASLSGSTLTLTGVSGTVVVRASQAGNVAFEPAPDITQSFTVLSGATNQVFFGLTQTSDTVAINIAPDGHSGTLLCYIAATGEAFIINFTLNPDGTFGATVNPAVATAVLFAERGESSAENDAPPRAAAATRTFTGRLNGATITGAIAELGLSFSTTLQPASGPTAPLAGLYQSTSVNSASGQTASIIGTQGQVFVVTTASSVNTGGTGTVGANGAFNIQAPGATITGSVDVVTTSVTGTIAVANRTPVTFSGLAATTRRTDRLINLSSRARIGPAAGRTLITGFVIGGPEAKRILLRAIGPALGSFGVGGVLSNPRLQLYNSAGRILAENDDWSGSDTATASSQVGAFALATGSRDAALLTTLEPGAYTMHVIDGGETGIALAEIYDASPNPQGEYQRLINISSRGTVEAGDGVLIGGFVVTGNSPKKMLVRGAGPALASFGVSGALADPVLTIYQGGRVVARNNDWSTPTPIDAAQVAATAAEINAAGGVTGAFNFTANAKDAAIVITLAPGAYTAQVSSGDNTTGVALVEIYEIPE